MKKRLRKKLEARGRRSVEVLQSLADAWEALYEGKISDVEAEKRIKRCYDEFHRCGPSVRVREVKVVRWTDQLGKQRGSQRSGGTGRI
jgi:hypothetical protein